MNKLIEAMVRTDVPSETEQLDVDTIQDILRQIHDRFVDERVKGFVHPSTGEQVPPVSREEAEQRWLKARQQFARVIARSQQDPVARRRLGVGRRSGYLPKSSTYSDPEAQAAAPPEMDWQEYERGWHETPHERAMREEPSLRRGESAKQMVNKLIG